jgi:hypothetical protein
MYQCSEFASGSGSVGFVCFGADPHPDPYQNVTDPQQWFNFSTRIQHHFYTFCPFFNINALNLQQENNLVGVQLFLYVVHFCSNFQTSCCKI